MKYCPCSTDSGVRSWTAAAFSESSVATSVKIGTNASALGEHLFRCNKRIPRGQHFGTTGRPSISYEDNAAVEVSFSLATALAMRNAKITIGIMAARAHYRPAGKFRWDWNLWVRIRRARAGQRSSPPLRITFTLLPSTHRTLIFHAHRFVTYRHNLAILRSFIHCRYCTFLPAFRAHFLWEIQHYLRVGSPFFAL